MMPRSLSRPPESIPDPASEKADIAMPDSLSIMLRLRKLEGNSSFKAWQMMTGTVATKILA